MKTILRMFLVAFVALAVCTLCTEAAEASQRKSMVADRATLTDPVVSVISTKETATHDGDDHEDDHDEDHDDGRKEDHDDDDEDEDEDEDEDNEEKSLNKDANREDAEAGSDSDHHDDKKDDETDGDEIDDPDNGVDAGEEEDEDITKEASGDSNDESIDEERRDEGKGEDRDDEDAEEAEEAVHDDETGKDGEDDDDENDKDEDEGARDDNDGDDPERDMERDERDEKREEKQENKEESSDGNEEDNDGDGDDGDDGDDDKKEDTDKDEEKADDDKAKDDNEVEDKEIRQLRKAEKEEASGSKSESKAIAASEAAEAKAKAKAKEAEKHRAELSAPKKLSLTPTTSPSSSSAEVSRAPSARDIFLTVSAECEACRSIVIAHAARDPSAASRLFRPCRAVPSEMSPACLTWTRRKGGDGTIERLESAISPDLICITLKACTGDMISLIKRRDAAIAKLSHGTSLIQSGSLVLHKEDAIMKEMYAGTGPRRVDHRVEFPAPFPNGNNGDGSSATVPPPIVHIGLSRFAFPADTDARVTAKVTSVDTFGFQVEVVTWGETRLESVAVDWIAYSRSYQVRGEVRSGISMVKAPAGTQERRIAFPGTFAELPHVAVSVAGIDSDGARDAHFSARAIGTTKQGFTLQIRTHKGARIKWASISWVAFQKTTQMFGGSMSMDADNDDDFKQMYYPPLGSRMVERSVTFAPQTDLECENKVKAVEAKVRNGKNGNFDAMLTELVQDADAEVPKAIAISPVVVPWNATVRVRVPGSAPASLVAFVRVNDRGCVGAAAEAVPVDGLHLIRVPRGLTEATFKVCIGPRGATSDASFVALDAGGAKGKDGKPMDPPRLKVTRSLINNVKPLLIPVPPGIPTVVAVSGALNPRTRVAFVPLTSIGCPGAAKASGIVSPSMKVAVNLPSGDYKACHYASMEKGTDADYVEQWTRSGKRITLHVGAGKAKMHPDDVADATGRRASRFPEVDLKSAVLNDDPIAFWPLDDRHGSISAHEVAGTKTGPFDASVIGAGVVFGAGGVARGFRTSVAFSGGTVEAREDITPAVKGAFAIEAWMSPTASHAKRKVVMERRGAGAVAGPGYSMLYDSAGHIVCEAGAGGGKVARVRTGAPLKQGSSYHVVCSHDGTRFAVYVNGLESSATTTKIVPSAAPTSAPTKIGTGFGGSIGAVAVYAKSLPADRVYAHFRRGFVAGTMPRCAARKVDPPHFSETPSVAVMVASFNFLRGSAANVRAMSTRADAAGFTLSVSTWGNSRLHDIELSWIAHSQPPTPPPSVMAGSAANRAASGAKGESRRNPARSCLDIHVSKSDRGDGFYFLRTLEGRVVKVYCDMSDGGWTRVVNISPLSGFHAGNVKAMNAAEIWRESEPAKLSDANINAINTVGYFMFRCGDDARLIKNPNNLFTSALGNTQRWQSSKSMRGDFSCSAVQPGNVFGEGSSKDPTCKKGYIMYGSPRNKGCYVDGKGWQAGSVWAK